MEEEMAPIIVTSNDPLRDFVLPIVTTLGFTRLEILVSKALSCWETQYMPFKLQAKDVDRILWSFVSREH